MSGKKFIIFNDHVKVIGDGAFFSQLMQMKDGYLDGHEGKISYTEPRMATARMLYLCDDFTGMVCHVLFLSSTLSNYTIDKD